MYLNDGLSAKQIAEAIGISKTVVLDRLHAEGIRMKTGKDRVNNPDNYRLHTAPYGWKVKDGKLAPNKAELKICRRVVTLVRQGLSYNAVAKELTKLGLRGRSGKAHWDHSTVISIYKRWNEKL